MTRYEVRDKAEFQPCWISYVGATTAVLNSVGVEVDRADVAGYTGYAFVVNVSKAGTCPSGPTAHDAFEEFPRGFEDLGWKVDFSHRGPGYEPGEEVTEEQRHLARSHFEEVSRALQETERPVVIWGAPIPEFAIVNGVEDDRYIVSSVRALLGQPDDPVRYDAIQAPGGVMKVVFKEAVEVPDQAEADTNALRRALAITEGKFVEPGYVMGPDALEIWADNLGGEEALYGGNAYVGACTQEAFAWAEMFLSRMADRYKAESQGNHLGLAAAQFDGAQRIMDDFTDLFPMSWERDFQNGDRQKGSQLLIDAQTHFRSAIEHLHNALSAWTQ